MNDMKQCPNGHFYYPDKTPVCPYCNPATASQDRTIPSGGQMDAATYGPNMTSPFDAETRPNTEATTPVFNGSGFTVDGDGVTRPAENPYTPDGRTVPVLKENMGFDPVVGWLVCIDGPSRGRDYRIHSCNNEIGRDSSVDIVICGDNTISQKEMAFVAYDTETTRFIVTAGKGRNLVRINGELLPVSQSQTLAPYDRIKLGKTELIFIPLCGEKFDWA